MRRHAIVVALLLCACEARQAPQQGADPKPAAPASKPEPPKPSEPEPEIEPAPLTGEGPSGAVGREARRQAVLDLLGDGSSAAALELSVTDPGKRFDPDLDEAMTPKVWVSDRPHKVSGKVTQGKFTVDGPLDREVIRRIVRAHINELRYCYESGLGSTPSLAGSVTINFVITGSGKVGSSVVAKSTLSDSATANCFAKAFKRWSFPKPSGGDLVKVDHEFKLGK